MNRREPLGRAVAGFSLGGGCSLFRIAGSGALLNNPSGNGAPLFLTARHHFLFGGKSVRLGPYPSFEAVWDYTEKKASFARSRGAVLLASDAATDTALLLLKDIPPNRTFLGWQASVVEQREFHRLSHPYGYPQAYAYHSDFEPGALFHQTRFNGILGPGSSGAPLVTADLHVVGQLWGVRERDGIAYAVDGAFAHAYEKMRQWLDPLGMGEASPNHNDQISYSPPG